MSLLSGLDTHVCVSNLFKTLTLSEKLDYSKLEVYYYTQILIGIVWKGNQTDHSMSQGRKMTKSKLVVEC